MPNDSVNTEPRKGFRTDIEGIRAIAILLVVFYHAGVPGFSGGYVGVDVFFVLSGYLITSLLYSEYVKTGTIRIMEFYSRRVRRLLPALGALLLFTVVASYIVYSPIEQFRFASTALATAAYVSNIYFAKARTDYLGPRTDLDPLLHTWSLSVEEQFYLVYPLFVLAIIYLVRRWTKPWRLEVSLSTGLALVCVISLAISIFLTEVRQPWAFFMMPSRAWEFALGGLGYLVPVAVRSGHAITSRYEAARTASGWIALFGLIATAAVFTKATQFPGVAAIIPAGLTAVLLCCSSLHNEFSVKRILDLRLMQEIGRLSYSWYLWHWPLLVLFNSVFKFQYQILVNCLLVLIALGISVLSYRYIEYPFRHSKVLSRRPMNALAMATALTVICVGVTAYWGSVATREMSSAVHRNYVQASDDVPAIYGLGCHANFHAIESKGCVFGNKNSEVKVVLLGDSHAAHWFPALSALAERNHWSLTVFTKSACPPVDKLYINQSVGRLYYECKAWQDDVIKELDRLQPALVVISASTGYDYSIQEWEEGTRDFLTRLTSLGGPVVTIRDTPTPGFNVPACLSREEWYRERVFIPISCVSDRTKILNTAVFDVQTRVVSEFEGAYLLDMSDLICSGEKCEPEREGAVIYRDDNHLTASFSESLAPALGKRLSELIKIRNPNDQLFVRAE